jgi:hypothetical protein
MTARKRAPTVLSMIPKREANLPERKAAEKRAKDKRRDDRRVDEESAESFPASDPPSYAGGPHSVGGPRRPKRDRDS